MHSFRLRLASRLISWGHDLLRPIAGLQVSQLRLIISGVMMLFWGQDTERLGRVAGFVSQVGTEHLAERL